MDIGISEHVNTHFCICKYIDIRISEYVNTVKIYTGMLAYVKIGNSKHVNTCIFLDMKICRYWNF